MPADRDVDLLIRGGRVFDPRHGVDGEVRSVALKDGRVVDAKNARASRTVDAKGCVVMPGGIDMHSHIAGTIVSRARRLLAEEISGGVDSPTIVPTAPATGALYTSLGYTTVVEAAVAPSAARQCTMELSATRGLESGFLLLLANNELLLDLLACGERDAARNVASALLRRTGAFGIKAVNPGGVALWKRQAELVDALDQPIGSSAVTPGAILELLQDTAEELGLPHPLHVHCNRLGLPGNIETTLETSARLGGRSHHLTHVQFHAYGTDEQGGYTSAAARLAEHLDAHPEVTADIGQVMLDEALTLSADEGLEYRLWQLTGKRYVNLDTELETGCGMVHFQYAPRSQMHALQWAVGLELLLLVNDPWKLALTTDHPNGGSFLKYPKLIAQLMSRDARAAAMEECPHAAIAKTSLPDLTREYSLSDVAVVTRAGPARALGLDHKGHLGIGADADVVVYDDVEDREAMFRHPRYVVRSGEVVFEKGELRTLGDAAAFRADIEGTFDESSLVDWNERYGSYPLVQLGPGAASLASAREVARR